MACRTQCSSTTACPGAMPRGASTGPASGSGCSSSAFSCCTADPITHRAVARMSASTARSSPKCSRCGSCAILPRRNTPSMSGARSTISSGHMRHSTSRCRPSRYGSARDRCRSVCHRPSMMSTTSCAPSVPPKRLRPASKDAHWKVPQGFQRGACRHQATQPRRNLRRLLRIPPDCYDRIRQPERCRPCPRTPVGHVPGMNNKGGGAVALSAHS